MKDPVQADGHDLLPSLGRHRVQLDLIADARVVVRDGQPTESLRRVAKRAVHRRSVGDVDGVRRRPELSGSLLNLVLVDVEDYRKRKGGNASKVQEGS